MKIQRLLIGALAALGLLMSTACVATGTETSGTALYTFDADSLKIMAWDDVETLYAAGATGSITTLPDPDRTLTSDYLSSFSNLAYGGMCMDRSRNRLWLVSDTGKIARIDSIRSRTDGTNLGSSYIRTFQLGSSSSDRLSDGTFGQIAVDVSSGALYITEYTDSESRIWVLSTPTGYAQGDTVASSAATLLTASADYYGYGVALGSSNRVYAYFKSGDAIEDANGTTHSGARLRLGTASGGFTKVIVGSSNTKLSGYGLLGADTANNLVYAARYNTTNPVIVFKNSQFSSGYDVAPSTTLPQNSTTPQYIRTLAHPGNKDWVVGSSTSTSGSDPVHLTLWKSPSTDTSTEPVIFNYGTSIMGIALDGSASSD